MTDQEKLLRERYGKREGLPKRTRTALGVLGVALMTLGALWAAIANYSPITFQDISFTVVDAKSAKVEFEVSKPKDQTVICTVEALSEQFAQVGFRSVEIGPQETEKVRLEVSINTFSLATTALVDECVLK